MPFIQSIKSSRGTGGSPLSLAASSNSVVMKPLGPRALSL
jgi:hypothetical protein